MNKTTVFVIVIVVIFLIATYMSKNKLIKLAYNERLSDNFILGELLVTNSGLPNIPNQSEIKNLRLLTVNVLQPARTLLNTPIVITSAFRSKDVNKSVGGVDNSQHRLGLAADFNTPKMDLNEAFYRIANSMIPYDQIIIETGKRGERWIHISYNPKKPRRQKLAANWSDELNKMVYTKIT